MKDPRRKWLRVLLLAVSVAFAVPSLATAEYNPYAEGLDRAKSKLDAAHSRFEDTQNAIGALRGQLPSARDHVEAAVRRAQPLEIRALAAEGRASAASDRAGKRRADAHHAVVVSQAADAVDAASFRHHQAGLASFTGALLALSLVIGSGVATARWRRQHDALAAAHRVAALVGASMFVGLAAVVWLLRVVGGWAYRDVELIGPLVVLLGLPVAVWLAWSRACEVVGRWLSRLAAAAGVMLIAVAAVLAWQANDRELPADRTLDPVTLRLASLYESRAPLPVGVQRAVRRADAARDRANIAKADVGTASDTLDRIRQDLQKARYDRVRVQRSISHWSEKVRDAQDDYDSYKSLTDLSDDDYEVPDVEIPDVEIPDVEVPDVSNDYTPTTEDFGSGTGSVGTCADGTVSDSIGRPGACSHHGGVG